MAIIVYKKRRLTGTEMNDNVITTIQDQRAITAYLDLTEKKANERIWRQLGLNKERAEKILSEIGNPVWPDVKGMYLKGQCEAYLKSDKF